MGRRAWLLIGALALGGGCDPAGCTNEPVATARRPAQPVTRPSNAPVTTRGRGDPEPEYVYEPEPPAARSQRAAKTFDTTPRVKPPPPPRLVRGIWRYSTTGRLVDEYLGGKKKSRFKKRVQVTGKILRVIDLGRVGGRRLWLNGGKGRFAEARFRDNGQAALALRQGRTVTVDCVATGKIGKNVQLTDCILR